MNRLQHILMMIMMVVACLGCSGKKEPLTFQLEGTPVRLVPPPGYKPAPALGGLQHVSKRSAIVALELPTPFEDAASEIVVDTLARQGIRLLEREDIKLQHDTGVLYKIQRLVNGSNVEQWMLLLPYGQSTISVAGTYMKTDEKELAAAIKNALLSVQLDGQVKHAALPFSVHVKGMRAAKVLPGPSVVFTTKGDWNNASLQSLSFFAGSSDRMPGWGAEETARSQFREMCPTCTLTETSISHVSIDSLRGVELWGYTPARKLKYEMVLLDTSKFFVMIGTADSLQSEMLAQYREASRTFSRRRKS
ncbi:hypothetical protein [Chryseolinea lacunae]|uniref:Uncharacterized protein n=1 Tax=Chryseolinea lacunae TaxID=2801331 RepID=A0ABS1L3S9_9BACT|nr:hypothetical protein [Chryseolinea lacunae]MBL0745597.1 hypothetical protein [Chryseolinea lacunae]